MPQAFQLSIRGTARVIPVPDGVPITVGRVAQCDLHLDDQAVSRRHCTIERSGTGLLVTDLDSANGTYLNEQPVKTATAFHGDVIRVGSTVLDVRDAAVSSIAAPTGPHAVIANTGRYESVIQKRFEPAQFEWLSSGTTAPGPDLRLLHRAARHLTTLHKVSEVLASARDLAGVSEATLRTIFEVTRADRAAVVLRRSDPSTGEPEVVASRGRTPDQAQFSVSQTIVSDVIENGLSIFANDATRDDRFQQGQSVIRQQVRSVMCVPLRTTDAILGAIYVDSLSGAGQFTEADLELLASIGNQAGVALHRVRLMGELERLLIDMIRAIAATIDAKDGYTHRHSERVALLSRHIASHMGLSPSEQETVGLSALLHDVGKIAVPDSILNKPGRLTPEEFDAMKKHPAHGARILDNIQSPSVRAVLPGVQFHHEKWDGTGYPEGLSGENIPLLGRLLGIADFFDALTSARAYRPAMPVADAVQLIDQGAGTHFDPAIAALVVALHERGALLPDGWES
jgi:HD-GYP domain-containing protein (c-di-GMP phosphodiesterase class II)/pSer/pThr/pTyr-binding forkhead associated (FHA) protein